MDMATLGKARRLAEEIQTIQRERKRVADMAHIGVRAEHRAEHPEPVHREASWFALTQLSGVEVRNVADKIDVYLRTKQRRLEHELGEL